MSASVDLARVGAHNDLLLNGFHPKTVCVVVAAFVACGARTDLESASIQRADACVPTNEVHVTVPATVPWSDTGVDVTAGAALVITASGTVRYGPMPTQVCDANGVNFDGTQFFSTAVLPTAIIVSLIGKVGSTPLPEASPGKGAGFVGTSYDQAAATSGRLFLGFNDQLGQFGDNSGSFSVAIAAATCH